jgi:hypothetical protein
VFLLTQVTSLKWGMLNPDALKTGSLCNAFLFTDSDVKTAQGINWQIDFIQQGGATPSYADAQLLLKAKINLPGPEDSLRCVLCMLAVFHAVLPHQHPLVSFLKEHYGYTKAYDPGWTTYPTHVAALWGLKGVYHLQWLSLKITKYFTQVNRNVGDVRCPDPHKIINFIQEQQQWEPNLTKTFTNRYNLRAFLGLHTHTPSLQASTVNTPQSVGGTSLGPSVSGLTAPTSVTGTGKLTAVKDVDLRVENPHFNEPLFGMYKTSALKTKAIRDRIKNGKIPPLLHAKNYSLKPMCLA